MNENKNKTKITGYFVVFHMQDIVQILQHNILNNFQITHNYLPSKNTEYALWDSPWTGMNRLLSLQSLRHQTLRVSVVELEILHNL